jgi:hypothetical protein
MRNETKWQALEIIGREIARFRGIVCFQRLDRLFISLFSLETPNCQHALQLAISPRPAIIADNSEERKDLPRPILSRTRPHLDNWAPPLHCMRDMTPALRIIRICIIRR